VDLDRQAQTLSISWEDGHVSGYSAAALRWACPCAECRGEGFGTVGRLDRATELPAAETEIDTLVLVGRYALQIAFKSGHGTGIYTFRYLRSLCNCPECARKAG
jgi:DUF971 family protein